MKLLLCVFLCFVIMSGCKNNSQPTADELLNEASKAPGLGAGINNYSITAPDGWIKKDTVMNGIKILFIYAPSSSTDDFHPNMNVISEAMGKYNFDEYMQRNMQTIERYITNYHAVDSGSITVNGMQGKWARYTQTQNGIDMENMFYVLPKNGIAYGVTSTTRKGEMDKYRNDFEAIVKTLKVQ